MNVNKLVVAARFNVNARGYRSVLKAVDGLPSKLTDLTKEEARLVDADEFSSGAQRS